MWSFDDLRSAACAGFEISQGESAMKRREHVQEHRFSPELIAAVESAFFPGQTPHEMTILRILTAVVPVVRQECGVDDMRDALEAVVDSVIADDERGNIYALGRLHVAVKKSSAALAKARGEGV